MSYRYYPVNTVQPDFSDESIMGIFDERDVVSATDGQNFVAWPDRTDRLQRFRFQTFTPTEWAAMRNFLDYIAGRARCFYQPTWAADFELVDAAEAGDTVITVSGHWHTTNVNSNRPDTIGRRLMIVDQTGATQFIWVTEVAADGANDVLTFDDPLTSGLEAGRCLISLCYLSRLLDDSVDCNHLSPGHVATDLSFREVSQRRKFNQRAECVPRYVGTIPPCAEMKAHDQDPIFPDPRFYAALGPAAYATPEAGPFATEWEASINPLTNVFAIAGPSSFNSSFYDGTSVPDQITFAFDADGVELIAWAVDGAIRVAWSGGAVDFTGFSPVMWQTMTVADVDPEDSDVVVFYLKADNAHVYCRLLSQGFANERLYCQSPIFPIWLQRARLNDGGFELNGMDASHRRLAYFGQNWGKFGDLVITYTWPEGMIDLDTGTNIDDATVGYGYGATGPFMTCDYDGPNIEAGPEVVVVNLAQAYVDGAIGNTAVIRCAADWYPPALGSGPATMSVEYNGVTKVKAISPGTGITPATTEVAIVTAYIDGTFILD